MRSNCPVSGAVAAMLSIRPPRRVTVSRSEPPRWDVAGGAALCIDQLFAQTAVVVGQRQDRLCGVAAQHHIDIAVGGILVQRVVEQFAAQMRERVAPSGNVQRGCDGRT